MFVLKKGNTFKRNVKVKYPTEDGKFAKFTVPVVFRMLTNDELAELRPDGAGAEYAKRFVFAVVESIGESDTFRLVDDDGKPVTDPDDRVEMVANDAILADVIGRDYLDTLKKGRAGN